MLGHLAQNLPSSKCSQGETVERTDAPQRGRRCDQWEAHLEVRGEQAWVLSEACG